MPHHSVRQLLAHGLAGLAVWLSLSAAASAADVTPPTVTLTSPSPDAVVFGGIGVTADASDDVGVVGVQFLLDGAALGAEDTAAPYALGWNTAAVPNGSHTLSAQARDAAGRLGTAEPVTITIANTSAPEQIGQWGPLMTWPVVAIHMTLLADGQVLIWDSDDDAADTAPRLWDPTTQLLTEVPVDGGLFCAGNALLADGQVLAAGGHPFEANHHEMGGPGLGITDAHVFDPVTRLWSHLADMRFPRWYPTLIPLSNGELMALSGQFDDINWADTPEVYNPATDRWRALPTVNTSDTRTLEYLRAHLMPDGQIYVIHPDTGRLRLLDAAAGTWTTLGTVSSGLAGSTTMYRPGRLLVTGSHDGSGVDHQSQRTAKVLDSAQGLASWRATTPMTYGRFQHNLLPLPDGTVIAIGGADVVDTQSTTGVLPAERWDPSTEAWTTLAPMSELRMYHSTVLLLPDGRVLSAGGGRAGAAIDHFTAQLYSPPYLFQGPRPAITAAPSTVGHGEAFAIQTPDSAEVGAVVLISLGSNTHTISMGQHYVELPFTVEAGGLQATLPASPGVLPPGMYLLFLVTPEGVPSVGSVLRVPLPAGSGGPPPAGAFVETAGQVVLEAEHFDEKILRSGADWVARVDHAGFSRTAYVQALPNSGLFLNNSASNYPAASPELIFNVQFTTTGTYYVWVRGAGATASDDSVHLGLDGVGPASADRLSGFGTDWTWRRDTLDGAPVTLTISTPGVHTIHLWLREDGVEVDKLLLRKSSSSTAPGGLGPAESGRTSVLPDVTPPSISNVAVEGLTPSAATLTWTTDELANSEVAYGETSAYGSLRTTAGLTTSHRVTLSPLTPGTLYHVQVRSRDAAGHTSASDDLTFSTLSDLAPACAPVSTLCVDDTAGLTQEYLTLQDAADVAQAGETILVYDGVYGGFETVRGGTAAAPLIVRAVSGGAVVDGSSPSGDGINVKRTDYVVIDGLSVRNATRAGIRLFESAGVVVQNARVGPNGRWGIFTGYTPAVQILNNTAFGSAQEHGIYVSNSLVAGDAPVIRGNDVFDNAGNGIQVNGDCYAGGDGVIQEAVLEHNRVHGNGLNGFSLISMRDSTVQNNLLYENGTTGSGAGGIHLTDEPGCGKPSTNNLVVNNTVVEPRIAGIRITDGAVTNILFNNLLVDGGLIDEEGGNQISSASNLHVPSTAGVFTNPASGDYHLTPSSPAVDAGLASFSSRSAPSSDLEGTPRPFGPAHDVGADETDDTIEVPPPPAFAFQETAGQVVMEAEHYDSLIARSSHNWTLETAKAGFGGTGYLSVLPNSGLLLNSGYPATSPELVFNVQFTTTGTYYVWVRGAADSGNDDSLHAGLDGGGPASADRLSGFGTGWTWKRDTLDGPPATLVISSPGVHTIHLWMREDGLRVDRLLLRTSSSSTAPSGTGPGESPRGSTGPDTTAPSISAVTAGNLTATSATVTWTTDESTTSQVEYGLDATYGQTSPLDSSLVTSHSVPLSSLSPETTYHFRVHSVDAASNAAVSEDGTFTTPAVGGASGAFQEIGGQLVIEAEHYETAISRSSRSWQLKTSQSGFGGTGYEEALPNSGLTLNSGYATTSPELVFRATFTTTGTYYIWVRGAGPSTTDDSVHFGVDGAAPASADRIHNFGSSWSWKRDTMDGAPATLVISTPGVHTLHLWMREDGVRVDRFLLRTSSSSTAPSSGKGPAESPRTP